MHRQKNMVRVLNPARRKNGGLTTIADLALIPSGILSALELRERFKGKSAKTNPEQPHGHTTNTVRVLNPAMVNRLSAVTRNAKEKVKAEDLFFEFRGRIVRSSNFLEARPTTPKIVAELGGLVEIVLDGETARNKNLRCLDIEVSNDNCDKVLRLDSKRVKLAADGNGDLHIVGLCLSMPEGFARGRSHFLGNVVSVAYRTDKPHIEKGVLDYEHEFAEHGGDYPKLYYKDGYLFFRGGTYTITSAGIVG